MFGERTELLITTVEDTNKRNVDRRPRPSVRFKIDKGDKFPPERNTWRPKFWAEWVWSGPRRALPTWLRKADPIKTQS